MLSLDSPAWSTLQHAYGRASDVPDLLRQLESFPSSEGNAEPWFSIWSALAHQGDVYTASFAAVPHVVQVLASDPPAASFDYFRFPAWVEICRQRHAIAVPDDLAGDYFDALKTLGNVVCAVIDKAWNRDFLVCALAALAVSKGFPLIGEAIQELDDSTAESFLKEIRG
jgi:hypothetical protein